MKFLFAFLLLSSASAEEKTVCKSTGDVFYKGPAILIDNDSSGSVRTQGDVFIADTLQVAGSVSTFPSIKAICTLTAVNPLGEGAFCTLETTLTDGKIMAMGTVSSCYYLLTVSFPYVILPYIYIYIIHRTDY